MVLKRYKEIYNYALSLGFKIGYIQNYNSKNMFRFVIYRHEFSWKITNFTLEDIKLDIENIYSNLDKEILKKDLEIITKIEELLKDYSKNLNNTCSNNCQLNELKKYLFISQDIELKGLELLREKLKKFDYTAIFSDSFGTSNFWESKENEINILIELLKKSYKEVIKDFIRLYNINEFGTKFYIEK